MMGFFKLLWGTVLLRPYVFVFFACYLFLAISIGLHTDVTVEISVQVVAAAE